MKIISSFAAVMFVSLFIQSANAQNIVAVNVFGSAYGEATAEVAVAAAEGDYYANAADVIAGHPPFTWIETEAPETTVYPNPDGTFDAVSSGNVWFDLPDYHPLLLWWPEID